MKTTICAWLLVLLAVGNAQNDEQGQQGEQGEQGQQGGGGGGDIVDFSNGNCQEDCGRPGYFCGTDGVCHEFSCQNFYEFGDPKLTGYDAGTPLQCLGYNQGSAENRHGVMFGCSPLFSGAAVEPGKQVTYPFNERCTAERDGFSYTCYQFQDDATATSFGQFEQQANSAFPDCGQGQSNARFFAPVTASAHYLGTEGLQGNPIISSGSDVDGDTMWQENAMPFFNEEIAMFAMYADVVGGPEPGGDAEGNNLGLDDQDLGPNPLDNQNNGGGDEPDSGAVERRSSMLASLVALVVVALL